MKDYLKQNKIAIIKYALIILLSFILGVMTRPTLSTMKQNIKDMFAKPVQYEAVDEREIAVQERMKSPQFVEMIHDYASGQIAREEQIKLDRKASEEGMKADKALTSFAEKYDASLSKYTEQATVTSKAAVKDAIRNSKM